jgi:hypothetical protein
MQMHKIFKNSWVGLAAILFAFTLAACSSKHDNAQGAKDVANQWVSANIDTVSGKLAEAVAKDYSALAKPVIAMLLKSGMEWQYAPRKIGGDHWMVTVTAKNSIDLSKIYVSKIANVSGSIDLDIDTSKQTVNNFTFNSSASQVQFVSK